MPEQRSPDFAEPVLGLAEGKARGLNPDYSLFLRSDSLVEEGNAS
jgi:hypothetical protein